MRAPVASKNRESKLVVKRIVPNTNEANFKNQIGICGVWYEFVFSPGLHGAIELVVGPIRSSAEGEIARGITHLSPALDTNTFFALKICSGIGAGAATLGCWSSTTK